MGIRSLIKCGQCFNTFSKEGISILEQRKYRERNVLGIDVGGIEDSETIVISCLTGDSIESCFNDGHDVIRLNMNLLASASITSDDFCRYNSLRQANLVTWILRSPGT